MTDRIFTTAGDWALASDGIQWMLMRRHRRQRGSDTWDPVSFVHSTKDILARCAAEKGVDHGTATKLLDGLPDTFDEFLASQPASPAAPLSSKTGTDP
jgi:hypothetical protein